MNNEIQLEETIDNRIYYGRIIYISALILFLVMTIIPTTTFPTYTVVVNFTKIICYILLTIKLVMIDRYKVKQFLILILIGIISLIAARQSGYTNLFLFVMFMISARNVNFRDINQTYFIIGCTIVGLAFIASKIGLIENLTYYRGDVKRQSFGIIYPTDFAAHIFYLILSYCFLINRRLKAGEAIICLLLAAFIDRYADARLDVFLIILTVVFFYVLMSNSFQNLFQHKIRTISALTPSILFIVSFMISYFYKPFGILAEINSLLSGRLGLANKAFQNYPIKLFGQPIQMIAFGGKEGNNLSYSAIDRSLYFFIDSSYIYTLLRYGVLFTIILLTLLSLKTKKTKLLSYNLIIILVCGSAFVDQTLVNPAYNIFLFSIFATIDNYQNNIS